MRSALVVLLTAFALAAGPTVDAQSATTWYVSPSGADSNPGTAAQPFRSIQRAANVVNPGDTVIVEDGTYTGTGAGTSCASSTVRPVVCLSRGGTSSAWVTFKARNRGRALVDGQRNTSTHGFRFLSTANYIRLEGFQIFGMGSATNGASGIVIYSGGHDVVLKNNEIHSIGRLCTDHQYGMNGIFIQNARVVLDGNRVHNIGRYAPGESGCNPSSANYQNHDHGVYVNGKNDGYAAGARDVTIMNNEFINLPRGWAIQVYPDPVANLEVVNNTFAFANPYRDGHIILAASTSYARIQNNIFYRPRNVALNFSSGTHTAMDVSNNIVYGASLMPSVSGVTAVQNSVADPKFVNASTSPYDLRLTSTSPAVDQGLTLSEVTEDFYRQLRNSGAYDIGAHERAGTTAPPPPSEPPPPSPSPTDTTPPVVAITSPKNGEVVSRKETIHASASDNVGVVKVVFAVNGKTIATDTSAPYSTSWRSSSGQQTITATAYDAAGNTATASITVRR